MINKILLVALLLLSTSAQAVFSPPIGVPDPGVVWASEDSVTWDPMDLAIGTPTKYVDQNNVSCSDAGPASEAVPLCNIPNSINAGEIVRVTDTDQSSTYYPGCYMKGAETITFNGTSSSPAILSFVNAGFCDSSGAKVLVVFNGDNWIVDGLRSYGVRVLAGDGVGADPLVTHHYVIRNSTISWMKGACVVYRGANGILYNNVIHHCIGDDAHATGIQGNLSTSSNPRVLYTWMVDNEIYLSGGNGFQAKNAGVTDSPDFYWFARNEVYRNKETGFATKYTDRGVASQNEFYENKYPGLKGKICDTGQAPASHCIYTMPDAVENLAEYNARSLATSVKNGSSGDGSGTILGADGPTDDIYIIANRYRNHDNVGPDGVRKGRGFRSEATEQLYVAQNIVYSNFTDSYANEKGIAGTSLAFVCNNTFVDTDGSRHVYWGFRDEADTRWQNNIVYGVNSNPLLDVPQSGVATQATMTHNIWYDTTGTMDYTWKNTTVQSLTTSAEINALDEATSVINNNLFDNPDFTNVSANDFTLSGPSPAIDSGTDCMTDIETVYQTDFGNYATTLMRDFAGNAMPTTSVDMGALQVGSSPPAPTDSLPVCITCGQSPVSRNSGDAAFFYPVTMTDDDTDPVTITGFACIDTSGATGTWSMDTVANPDEIEFSGTTEAGTVTCSWDMIDTGNANTAAEIVFNIAAAESQVPPILAPIEDQSNRELDSIQISGTYTLTNGDAVSGCTFSTCPANLTENLTLAHNNNCAGTSTTTFCITGVLQEASGSPNPVVTVIVGTGGATGDNVSSGTATFSGNKTVFMIQSSRAADPPTFSACTINSVVGTEFFEAGTDGGSAIGVAGCYWTEAQLPTGGSWTWSFTPSTSNDTHASIFEVTDLDQTTPYVGLIEDQNTTARADGTDVSLNMLSQSGNPVIFGAAISDTTLDFVSQMSEVTSPSQGTEILHGDNARGAMIVFSDAAAEDADVTYLIDLKTTLAVTIDSVTAFAFALNPIGTGASENSPHSCGVYCTDNDGNSNTQTFTWNVTTAAANQPPVAISNTYEYVPGQDNVYTSVLLNDSDPDADPMTVTTTPVINVGSGVLVLSADGTFTYTPNGGFVNSDAFTYQVCDDAVTPLCDTAVVTLNPVPAAVITYNSGADKVFNATEGTEFPSFNFTGTDVQSWALQGGEDCSLFTINSTSGLFDTASGLVPIFTGVDDSYTCVTSADGLGGDDTLRITLNSNDDGAVPDPPNIYSNGGGATAAFGLDEEVSIIARVRATDATGFTLCGGADDALTTMTDSTAIGNFTTLFATDANNIDITAHQLQVNEKITLTTTGTLPAPLAISTTYYVVLVNGVDDIEISATQGGAAITLTDNGTGTHTMTRLVPIGVLTFDATSDFEMPTDANMDSTYVFCASANGNGSDQQILSVMLNDVAEVPNVMSPATASIQDGATIVTPTQECDEATATFIEVTDTGANFTIGSTTGIITKGSAFEFDDATPSNNTFSYTYKCNTSAGDSTNHTVTITGERSNCFLNEIDRRAIFRSMFKQITEDLKGCDILQ